MGEYYDPSILIKSTTSKKRGVLQSRENDRCARTPPGASAESETPPLKRRGVLANVPSLLRFMDA